MTMHIVPCTLTNILQVIAHVSDHPVGRYAQNSVKISHFFLLFLILWPNPREYQKFSYSGLWGSSRQTKCVVKLPNWLSALKVISYFHEKRKIVLAPPGGQNWNQLKTKFSRLKKYYQTALVPDLWDLKSLRRQTDGRTDRQTEYIREFFFQKMP